MLSDYDRTMELVNAAYDSAGSSQRQFEKTTESLESKLNRLKNAWDSFTMGLANNTVIKAGVDILTGILTVVNNITDAFGTSVGSILKFGIAIAGLAAGKKGFNRLFSGKNKTSSILGGLLDSLNKGKGEATKAGQEVGNNISSGIEAGLMVKASEIFKNFFTKGLDPKNIDTSALDKLGQSLLNVMQSHTEAISNRQNAGTNEDRNAASKTINDIVNQRKQLLDSAHLLYVSENEYLQILQLTNNASQSSILISNKKIAAKAKEILATKSLTEAQKAQQLQELATNNTTKLSIASRLKLIATLGFGNTAARQAAASALGLGAAESAQAVAAGTATVAQKALNLAVNKFPIGWAITAIAAVAGLISVLSSDVDFSIDDYTEDLEKAKNATEAANTAYTELSSNWEQYTNLKTGLDELIVGTNEWRDSLNEVNQEVLKLLQIYPQLSNYLSTSQTGELIISQEGYNKLYEERSRQLSEANAAQGTAQARQSRAESTALLQELGNDLGITGQQLLNFAEALRENYNLLNQGNDISIRQVLADAAGTTIDEIGEVIESGLVDNYIDAYNRAISLEESTARSNAASLASQDVSGSKYADIIADTVANQMEKNYVTDYENATVSLEDKSLTELQDLLKETNTAAFEALEEDQREDAEYLVSILEPYLVNDKYTELSNQLLSLLNRNQISETDLRFLSGEAQYNREVETSNLRNNVQLQQLLGYNEDSWNAIISQQEEYYNQQQEAIQNAIENLDDTGLQTSLSNMIDGIGIATASEFVDKFSIILAQKGNLAANELARSISEVLESDSISEAQRRSLLESFNNLDFSDTEGIKAFTESLEDLGYSIPQESLQNFIDQIEQLNGALETLSLADLEEKVGASKALVADIEGREYGNNTYTQDQMDTLITAGVNAEDFVGYGDQYTYIGDLTFSGLIQALNGNTNALIDNTQQQYQNQIDAANAAQAAMVGTNQNQIMASDANQLYFLQKVLNQLGTNQYVGQYNVGALREQYANTAVSGLSDQARTNLDEIVNILFTTVSEKAQNEQNLSNLERGVGIERYNTGQDILDKANIDEEGNVELTEAQSAALKKLMDAEEGASYMAEQLKTSLQEQGNALAENEDYINALALDVTRHRKSIDELSTALADNVDSLNVAREGTSDYYAALERVATAAREVFGDSITADFVNQNIDLFRQLAEGGDVAEQAFYDIGRAAMESMLQAEGYVGAAANNIIAIVSQLDSLSFDINGTADFSQIFMQLVALVGSAQQAAAIIEALGGYTVKFDQVGTQRIQVGWDTTIFAKNNMGTGSVGYTDNPSMLSNAMTTFETNAKPVYREVPIYRSTITKSGATGTGASIAPYTGGGSSGGGGGGGRGGSGGGGGSGAGSGAGQEEEPWENPYDWLYNLTEDINEELRKREKLELRYSRILKDNTKTGTDLLENIKDQVESLERERDLQQEMYDKRRQEMQKVMDENSSLQQYAKYDFESATIEIDWNAIDAVTDQEKGEEIEDYISRLEEIQDQMDEADDRLESIIDELEEIKDLGKDEFFDMEDRVIDALISSVQDQIDELSLINDSINNANDKLMTSIQNNLTQYRQQRSNEETEQNLGEMERRLAYLRQDTSGANQLEILNLEKQLQEGQEDYTDTLIDQKISELQLQNDQASEERQLQIELMQANLDYAEQNGLYWQQAHQLMKDGISAAGTLLTQSDLAALLKSQEGWLALSDIQQMDWLKNLEEQTKAAVVYFSSQRQLEKIGKTSGQITFTNSKGQQLTGTVDSKGNVTVKTADGTYTYKDVYQNYDGSYASLETNPQFTANKKPTSSKPNTSNNNSNKVIKVGGLINAGTAPIYDYAGDTSGSSQYYSNDPIYKVIEEYNGYLLTRWHKLSSGYSGWFKKSDVKAYAKGGLADFTGPAWLDGTKSNPEMVLNSKDTKNFIILKDLLSDLLNNSNKTSSFENSGDNYYEININVDELSNDYDVDKLASKIKTMIANDSMYRNVNTINILR